MSDVIIPVLIPIAVAVLGALVTVVYGPILKARRDRRRQAEDLEARYRDELKSSAFDLQNRLYQIAAEDLLARPDYVESTAQAESEATSTRAPFG
jgi:NADH:ubiquinone oxidoreductase subunit 3 (subunit A)